MDSETPFAIYLQHRKLTYKLISHTIKLRHCSNGKYLGKYVFIKFALKRNAE